MKETTRAFIAVELNENVRDRLKEIQDQLRQLDLDVKWVEPENIHITLRFLGDLSPQKLKTVCAALPGFIQGLPPFPVAINGLGAFPTPQKPKVIWAGVQDSNGELSRLAEQLETVLNACGIGKEDREFSAHITLGRVRSLKNISRLAETIPPYVMSPVLEQTVSKVTLFRSTLTAKGPEYESLLILDLK